MFTSMGDKYFYKRGAEQPFYVEGGGGNYDVDVDVSKANIIVSKASMLSAGARIPRGL